MVRCFESWGGKEAYGEQCTRMWRQLSWLPKMQRQPSMRNARNAGGGAWVGVRPAQRQRRSLVQHCGRGAALHQQLHDLGELVVKRVQARMRLPVFAVWWARTRTKQVRAPQGPARLAGGIGGGGWGDAQGAPLSGR